MPNPSKAVVKKPIAKKKKKKSNAGAPPKMRATFKRMP